MKTSFQKQSFGGGYGINRHTGGAASLPTAEPPLAHISVKPGPGIITPGSPKTGYKIRPAKVIGSKK
jgi:hypothetical protein